MKNKKRGLLTSLGAAAAALAFALGGASAAFAAPTTIDPDEKVNLNIVKLSTPDDAPLTPTGKVQTVPAGSTPIGGVKFTVKRITNAGDLTTNAGWQEAATVVYDAVTGTWTKGGGGHSLRPSARLRNPSPMRTAFRVRVQSTGTATVPVRRLTRTWTSASTSSRRPTPRRE